MINKYKIRIINGEERLVLYLDFNYEFASFKKTYKKSFKEILKDFFVTNKINFHGRVISLIVGGILIGNLVLNKPIEYGNYKGEVIDINKLMYYPVLTLEKDSEEINIIKENEKVIIEEPKKEIKKVEKVETNIEKKSVDNKVIEEVQNQVIDNNIYVNVKTKNGNITLELEEYIIGVVSAEMPALFHEEALKSQAIIARTYALKAIKNNRVLTDNESTQSYKNINELKSMWGSNYNTYYNKIKKCVNDTKGMYLSYNNDYIDAVYHSTSNGYTESSINVWGNYYPYLVSVESTYDYLNPSFIIEKEFTYQELSQKLNNEITIDTNFNIISLTESKRVKEIEINNQIYSGITIRSLLSLRSTDFKIEKKDNSVIITTKGYGHGVGLSQYGANGMARNGYSYESILKHYYKGVIINKK